MKLKDLNTKIIGKNYIHYNQIDSTQLEAWRNIDLENGTIIVADNQTLGKGTHGRVWSKPNKRDISFSIKINTDCNIKKLDNLTYEIATEIVKVFNKLYQIKLEIKMPNDIMINKKKVGGILTETKLNGEIVKNIVIGIGINLEKQVFPTEIREIATSIKNELDVIVDRMQIVTEFCNMFEAELVKREIL